MKGCQLDRQDATVIPRSVCIPTFSITNFPIKTTPKPMSCFAPQRLLAQSANPLRVPLLITSVLLLPKLDSCQCSTILYATDTYRNRGPPSRGWIQSNRGWREAGFWHPGYILRKDANVSERSTMPSPPSCHFRDAAPLQDSTAEHKREYKTKPTRIIMQKNKDRIIEGRTARRPLPWSDYA
jgi:hypothetical protein